MRYISSLAVLLFYQYAWPADSPEHKGAEVKNPNGASQNQKPDSSKNVPPINITVTQDNHSSGQECCTSKNENHEAEWWTAKGTIALAVITLLLAGIAIGQLVMFWKQLKLMKQGTKDATILANASKISAEAAKVHASTLMLSERAYVQLSHVSNDRRPGLVVNMTSGECDVSIGVKNHGATPAKVTRVFLTKRVLAAQLPAFPEYRPDPGEPPEQPTEAFLMKDVEIFVGFSFSINPADIPLIREHKKQLIVYGFVDYTDQFGRDFRGGYARNYVPDLLPNNLVFTPQPRYNYDCDRQNDTCKDWA